VTVFGPQPRASTTYAAVAIVEIEERDVIARDGRAALCGAT
jgi:hypothetical protein